MDIDWWELLKDGWLLYQIGKEIYSCFKKRQPKVKRRKLR